MITCLCCSQNGDGYQYRWLSLKPGEAPQESGGDNTIRVGLLERYFTDYTERELEKMFSEFYKLHPEYDIEIVTYDMDGTEFALDLVEGNGPDIIMTQFMDVDMLTDKGVLEDLTPYLAASEAVEEDLLPCVLRAMTVNGKIIRVLDEFSVYGNVVAAGTTDGGAWTPEEYLALGDQQTQGTYMTMYMSNGALFNVISECFPMTREEREELRYVLDHAYMSSPVSGVVRDIMIEEVQTFFAGDKSADEAAEIIQNRVSLYLSE